MFAILAALLLNLAPDAALSSPPLLQAPSISNSRSVSLLVQDTVRLARRVRSSHLLPVWVPLVAGLGGGALAAGLGYLALTSLSGYTIALGVLVLFCAPVFAVAGVIVAIVFAVKNVARQERLEVARQELARSRQELEKARAEERPLSLVAPWREGLVVPPALTVATF